MKKHRRVIYLSISGNYGNQLFQFLFALNFFKKYTFDEIRVCFGEKYGNKIQKLFKGNCLSEKEYFNEMGSFKRLLYNLGHSGRGILKALPTHFDNPKFQKFKIKFYSFFGIIDYRYLNYCNLSSKLFYRTNKLFIRGFFESRLYFEECVTKHDIQNLLFKKNCSGPMNNKVCVTIRRGDFLDCYHKDRFYVCDIEYFKKGIETIKKLVKNPKFCFYSDDIEWVKKHFNYIKKSSFESGLESMEEKLYSMSSCSHYILSNSTFSWWACYLCQSDRGVVISPRSWKANEKDDHLIEKDWVLL